MKRICRQHGISRWPSRKINKVNRSLSSLKRVMESVQGAQGAFDLQSLACPIPLAADFNDQEKGGSSKPPTSQMDKNLSRCDMAGGDDEHNELKPEERIGSHLDLSNSSGERSMDSATSPESSEEVNALPRGVLVGDLRSSKRLRNKQSHPTRVQKSKTLMIKASYKEERTRFRLPRGVGMLELKDEVAKRLKLEIGGTFEIKYLDDDEEWVILASDEDLEECLEITTLSGVHIIRLLVRDIAPLLGSLCESSD